MIRFALVENPVFEGTLLSVASASFANAWLIPGPGTVPATYHDKAVVAVLCENDTAFAHVPEITDLGTANDVWAFHRVLAEAIFTVPVEGHDAPIPVADVTDAMHVTGSVQAPVVVFRNYES